MSEFTLEDYRNAPSGIGPLAAEWKDKPHRLVYDLINLVKERDKEIASLTAIVNDYTEDFG